ncbi:transcription elongation factor TFIIS, partial [Tanacetum coccineum]
MEKELIELFESVKKAAEAGEEERCVDALNSLKNFPVNYQLLVSTQVGKRLRQLTKHPKMKIQSLASELVEIWKGVIVEETIKNKKNGNLDIMESPKSNNTPVMSQNKVDRANSFKAARKGEIKVIKMEDVKVEKNGHNVKVEMKPTINEVAPPKLTSLVYCKDPIRD